MPLAISLDVACRHMDWSKLVILLRLDFVENTFVPFRMELFEQAADWSILKRIEINDQKYKVKDGPIHNFVNES